MLICIAFIKLELDSLQLYVQGRLFHLYYPVTVDRLCYYIFLDEKQKLCDQHLKEKIITLPQLFFLSTALIQPS